MGENSNCCLLDKAHRQGSRASGCHQTLEQPPTSQRMDHRGVPLVLSPPGANSLRSIHACCRALGIQLLAQLLTSWVTGHVPHLSGPPLVVHKRKIIRPTSVLVFEDKYNSMHEGPNSGCTQDHIPQPQDINVPLGTEGVSHHAFICASAPFTILFIFSPAGEIFARGRLRILMNQLDP